MGNFFVSVYELPSRSDAVRNLDERFGFGLTLTMRVANIPLDRLGDQAIASKLARTQGKGQPSFNARMEQLRAFMHMNWAVTVLQQQDPPSANDNLLAWLPPQTFNAYGFVEPAAFKGMDRPTLVWADWFTASPDARDVGLKAECRFDGARRMQPDTLPVGPYV